MLSKRFEPTEVDRRTWLHVHSGTLWSTSSDTHQVVGIQKETFQLFNRLRYKYFHDLIERLWRVRCVCETLSTNVPVLSKLKMALPWLTDL